MKKFLRVFGALLTELKLFGILPLRTPLISILLSLQPNSFVIFILIFLYSKVTNANFIFSVENFNTFILYIITFGALVLIFSSSVNYQKRNYSRFLIYIYYLLSFISILQVFGFLNLENLFTINSDLFPGRASGLSAEPSFFAWMAGYFFLIGQSFHGAQKKIGVLFMLFIIFSTRSVTSIFIFSFFYCIKFISNISLKNKESYLKNAAAIKWNFSSLFWFLLICFFLLDVLFYSLQGVSLGLIVLEKTGSWREPSIYASFYGSDLIGPFSNGELWPSYLQKGVYALGPANRIVEWIIFPFSLFAMFCLEIGKLPTFLLIYFLTRFRNKKVKFLGRDYMTVSVVLFFLGLVLAPKWCVYYFILPPQICATNAKK